MSDKTIPTAVLKSPITSSQSPLSQPEQHVAIIDHNRCLSASRLLRCPTCLNSWRRCAEPGAASPLYPLPNRSQSKTLALKKAHPVIIHNRELLPSSFLRSSVSSVTSWKDFGMLCPTSMIVYYNGQYLQEFEVAISPDDRGFLFADGVYDVIRSYRSKLFKCVEHLERLAHGLKALRIEGLDTRSLEQISHQLIRNNKLEEADALVYLQVTRGAAPRSHQFPPSGTPLTVYVEAKAFSPPVEQQQNGAAAILEPDQRWSRCNIKTIGLLPNTLAHQRAREAGAFEAIFSGDGLLQEGSHSSILFVEKDVLICPPLTNRILPSITRSVVIDLALAESIEVDTRSCREGELFEFDEVMMLSTSAEIVPITSVNGRKIRQGYVGPVTRRLQTAFRRVIGPNEIKNLD